MIRGIIQKFQTYSTGGDGKFDVLIEVEDIKKALHYDKEKVYILSESEYAGKTPPTLEEIRTYMDEITQRQLLLMQTLKEMIEDGTFNAMFLADSQVQMVLSKANLSSRRVIELDNPTLSSNTPNKNSPLWFNPFQ